MPDRPADGHGRGSVVVLAVTFFCRRLSCSHFSCSKREVGGTGGNECVLSKNVAGVFVGFASKLFETSGQAKALITQDVQATSEGENDRVAYSIVVEQCG